MRENTRRLSWQEFVWLAGLTIVAVILALFVASFFTGVALNAPIALAFLAIGSGLMGVPSGWRIVRNGDGSRRNGRE